jgi:hypothetical protein
MCTTFSVTMVDRLNATPHGSAGVKVHANNLRRYDKQKKRVEK